MGTIHKITSHKENPKQADKDHPASILAIDIGGSKVKILAAGQTEPRKTCSGKKLTPAGMVEAVRELAEGWDYEAVSIGYPDGWRARATLGTSQLRARLGGF